MRARKTGHEKEKGLVGFSLIYFNKFGFFILSLNLNHLYDVEKYSIHLFIIPLLGAKVKPSMI